MTRPTLPVALPEVTLRTSSADQTRELAATLARVARSGDRIALVGPLGAGKTQFAKGFALGLGVRDVVNSPSFTLMAEYHGRLPLFHQDLYRLAGAEEVLAGGLLDERQGEGVTLTEWGDRLPAELDRERLRVSIEVESDEARTIMLSAASSGHTLTRYLEAARAWHERTPAGER